NNLFHISGTDIVRCLSFRFQAFGRPVRNTKKFEEGIFSDLRNLKAGTDASLEEPKSPFLDFLYKNNCIRTQKKQKVFYWYSVPHDRLFLDALERDLKREKMGQEPTTVAISEPALSFEFDASQSLFEQLTKAQQANTSSLNANVGVTYGHNASPMVRVTDSMPPPQMIPPSLQVLPEDMPAPMYAPVNMTSTAMHGGMVKVEQEYGQVPYARPQMPLRMAPRHTSMPAYMEYSPAPSFVSSQYDDYAARGFSYEPVTPPQNGVSAGTGPSYITGDDASVYSNVTEMGAPAQFNPLMAMPQTGFAEAQGGTYSTVASNTVSAQSRDLMEQLSRHGTPYSTVQDTNGNEREGSVIYMEQQPVDDKQQALANPAIMSYTDNLAQHKRTHDSNQGSSQGQPGAAKPTDTSEYATITEPDDQTAVNETGDAREWTPAVHDNISVEPSGVLMLPNEGSEVVPTTSNEMNEPASKDMVANTMFSIPDSAARLMHTTQIANTGLLTPQDITPQLLRQGI
ncbi:homeodomain transcription factor ste12, partial [Ascosphaera acerosa]